MDGLTRWRSFAYKEYIQCQPCMICEKDPLSEAHHQSLGYDGAKALKRDDTQLVPLCHDCHDAIEQKDWFYLLKFDWDQDVLARQAPVRMVKYLTEFLLNQGPTILKLLRLIDELRDKDPCEFDHHGNCQVHGMTLDPGDICPNEEARRLLTEKTLREIYGGA